MATFVTPSPNKEPQPHGQWMSQLQSITSRTVHYVHKNVFSFCPRTLKIQKKYKIQYICGDTGQPNDP